MTDEQSLSNSHSNEKTPLSTVRTRSPGYPSMNLETALERAKLVYAHAKRTAAPLEMLAAIWESNVKSSATLLAVSSLKKYGLLEEVNDQRIRSLKLSALALTLLLGDQTDSPERNALLKQAALTPVIYAKLWKHFNGDLPSDIALKSHLLLQLRFNDDAIPGFIKAFRETIQFAKLTPDDKISIDEAAIDDAEDDAAVPIFNKSPLRLSLSKTTASIAEANKATASQDAVVSSPSPVGMSILREFNFPLPTGTATLRVPFPMTEDDFDSLTRTLRNFKDGLVKSDMPTVDANRPDYEAQATALAESGIEFNLSNFNYSHDIELVKRLSKENNFQCRIDPSKSTAAFRRKAEEIPRGKGPSYY